MSDALAKGTKERVRPITKMLDSALKARIDEPRRGNCNILFPTVHGAQMSAAERRASFYAELAIHIYRKSRA
jgi:integrase